MVGSTETDQRTPHRMEPVPMPPLPPRKERFTAALKQLAPSPPSLLCLMLAANALAHPYRGLFHDARLYAAQIQERVEPGSLAGDLYLRYGSQDDYTLFSALMEPLVRAVGLEPAFFLGYLASKASFFWALTV